MTTETMAPTADRISFVEPARPRRFSTAVTSSTDEMEEDPFEDWTKTTHERDSWANRERRRSNKFAKIDNDVALQHYERSRSGRRASSALGLFTEGVDASGKAIILSDDHHEDFELPIQLDKDGKKIVPTITFAEAGEVDDDGRPVARTLAPARRDDRRLSMSSDNSEKRRGSILSLWKTGKDKKGRDHIHSGHEGVDWVEAPVIIETPPASPPLVVEDPRGRRGSILSIWRQGKNREGKTVMHSGEELDAVVVPLDEKGLPVVVEKAEVPEKPERERVGSILSIWSQGKDKGGKTVIHSGEEYEGPTIEIPVEKVESPKPRGRERRGSVLSMWTEDTRDTQEKPAGVVLKTHEEGSDSDEEVVVCD